MIQNLKQPQNPQAGRAANLDYYPSTPYSAVAKDLQIIVNNSKTLSFDINK
jgi:hypothetical protein